MQKATNFIYLLKNYQNNQIELVEKQVGILKDNYFYFPKSIKLNFNELAESDYKFFNFQKTDDRFKQKICNTCLKLLPIEYFQKNQSNKKITVLRRPTCQKCRKAINGKSISFKDRKIWQAKKPNLCFWTCPICQKTTIPGLNSKVVLDHNHKTGQVRGWICDSCNTGIGRFQDNIKTLENAIHFLKK